MAFQAEASNLVPGDTNGRWDVFVHDRGDPSLLPQPPMNLVATSIVGNRVTITWTPPATGPVPTDYVLEGGINPGDVLASIPIGSTTPTFTFVAPTGAFYIRVHTIAGASRSGPSNEIRIVVNLPSPPSAPTNLLGLVNGSTLYLSWTNAVVGATPTSLVLEVAGAVVASLSLPVSESFFLRRRSQRYLHVSIAGDECQRGESSVPRDHTDVSKNLSGRARSPHCVCRQQEREHDYGVIGASCNRRGGYRLHLDRHGFVCRELSNHRSLAGWDGRSRQLHTERAS